jgi:hypothetical protein
MTAGPASVLIGRDREVRTLTELIGVNVGTPSRVGVLGSALAAFGRIGATARADRARAEMTAALAGRPARGNHFSTPAGP